MLLLNYRPIPRQPTGIGVVAEALRPALSTLPHQLVPGGHADRLGQRLRRQAWSQWLLPAVARGAGARLIFTPVPEGYLGEQSVAQVVFVHDLRPLLHPAGGWQSLYYRRLVPALLRQCRHILTNSH